MNTKNIFSILFLEKKKKTILELPLLAFHLLRKSNYSPVLSFYSVSYRGYSS